jgi:hypothetical protein
VMFAAMLLPRPNAEISISEPPIRIGSPDQNSSPYGTGSDGVEENRPDAQLEPRDNADADAPQSDQPGKTPSADGQKSSEAGKQSSNDDSAKDERKSAESKSGDSGKKQEKQPAEKTGEKGDNNRADGQSKANAKRPPDEKPGEKQNPGRGSGNVEKKPAEKQPDRREENRQSPANGPRRSPLPHISLPPGTSVLTALFKWILYIVLAAVVVYAVWKNRAELLAALREWRQTLADLWQRLFGGKRREAEATAAEEAAKGKPLPRFADFTDPFAAGTAGRYRPEELVRYTFEALEAWARDTGIPRPPEQTPHEFARSLGSIAAPLADDTRFLADLYCQVAYAPGTLQTAMVARLPRLWQGMRAAARSAVGSATA